MKVTPSVNRHRSHPVAALPPFRSDPARACRTADPNLFAPPDGVVHTRLARARAKNLCRRCPLVEQCAAWAVEHHEYGVWGATDDDDRKAIEARRRSRQSAEVAA